MTREILPVIFQIDDQGQSKVYLICKSRINILFHFAVFWEKNKLCILTVIAFKNAVNTIYIDLQKLHSGPKMEKYSRE